MPLTRVLSRGCLPMMAVVVILASGDARAADPEARLLVDAPLVLTSVPASSGAGSEVLVWPSLRAGALTPVGGPFVMGGDASLSATYASAGTSTVTVARLVGALEARALAGASFGGRFTRVVPYLSGGIVLGGGPALLRVGERDATSAARLVVVAGARGGAGLLFRLGWLSVRGELGAGVLAGKPELLASLGVGVAL